jgi:hypothetical protein
VFWADFKFYEVWDSCTFNIYERKTFEFGRTEVAVHVPVVDVYDMRSMVA